MTGQLALLLPERSCAAVQTLAEPKAELVDLPLSEQEP